jgi:hypothetical protein
LCCIESFLWCIVSIAQSAERKTEDLEAACSIHARDNYFPFAFSFFLFV